MTPTVINPSVNVVRGVASHPFTQKVIQNPVVQTVANVVASIFAFMKNNNLLLCVGLATAYQAYVTFSSPFSFKNVFLLLLPTAAYFALSLSAVHVAFVALPIIIQSTIVGAGVVIQLAFACAIVARMISSYRAGVQKMANLEKSLKEKADALANLDRTSEHNKKRISDLTAEGDELKIENARLKKDLEQTGAEIKRLQESELLNRIQKLEQDLTTQKDKYARELESALGDYKGRIDKLNVEIDAARKAHDGVVASSKSEKTTFSKQLTDTQRQLTEAQQQVAALQTQLAAFQEQNATFAQENERLLKQNEALEKQSTTKASKKPISSSSSIDSHSEARTNKPATDTHAATAAVTTSSTMGATSTKSTPSAASSKPKEKVDGNHKTDTHAATTAVTTSSTTGATSSSSTKS